jgi:hypothetical protein
VIAAPVWANDLKVKYSLDCRSAPINNNIGLLNYFQRERGREGKKIKRKKGKKKNREPLF